MLEAGDGVLVTRVKLRPSPGPGSLQEGDALALRETLEDPRVSGGGGPLSADARRPVLVFQQHASICSQGRQKSCLLLGRSRKDIVNGRVRIR